MENNKVISLKNLPTQISKLISHSAIIYLLLVHFDASQLVWGIVCGIWAIVLILGVYSFISQKPVDIFDNKLNA